MASQQIRLSHFHNSDVMMRTMASQITRALVVYSNVCSDADNIEAPHRWPLCGQFTDHWRIPRTKGQWRGKCFHLMTSSFPPPTLSSHSVVALTLFVHWKITAILTKYSSLASPEVYKIATPVRGCIENISKMKSEIVHHGRTKFCRVSFETNIRLVYLVVMALKGLGGLFLWWKLPMMVAS